MWAMHDLVLMFLALFINFIIGLTILGIVLIVTYLAREQIKSFFLLVWSLIHRKSYRDYLLREEAEKSSKEGAK